MEPWLRGGITDVDPIRAAVLYSLRHAAEDVHEWVYRMPAEDVCTPFGEVASVAFHIRHMAGSIDRLTTYAARKQLSDTQLQELHSEHDGRCNVEELLGRLDLAIGKATDVIRTFDPASYGEIREVGRQHIPVPLGVLLVHIAEHTQRHVGELIMTVKIALGMYR